MLDGGASPQVEAQPLRCLGSRQPQEGSIECFNDSAQDPMKRLLFLALTAGTLLMGTAAYAQCCCCCCCGQMNGQQGTTPPEGVKK
jgi:hypothetical protein